MAKKTPPSANGVVPEFLRVVVATREPASVRAVAERSAGTVRTPSSGIHAVSASGSAIGQYGQSW